VGALEEANIQISDRFDDIIWAKAPDGKYSPKDVFFSDHGGSGLGWGMLVMAAPLETEAPPQISHFHVVHPH